MRVHACVCIYLNCKNLLVSNLLQVNLISPKFKMNYVGSKNSLDIPNDPYLSFCFTLNMIRLPKLNKDLS